ncbi:MAG: hypothetical protein M1416_02305 [Candidatus Pacearchaeota archaeon]|nr:hypothetical protein [Candidatus Pacearchaeota archaeon]
MNEQLKKDIIDECLDLYQIMEKSSIEENKEKGTFYKKFYEKILKKLDNLFEIGFFGSGRNNLLVELNDILDEIDSGYTTSKSAAVVETIKSAIKKILRYFDVPLPIEQKKENSSSNQISVQINPTIGGNIMNLSVDNQIQVQNLINELNKELDKSNNKQVVWEIIKKILKLFGIILT